MPRGLGLVSCHTSETGFRENQISHLTVGSNIQLKSRSRNETLALSVQNSSSSNLFRVTFRASVGCMVCTTESASYPELEMSGGFPVEGDSGIRRRPGYMHIGKVLKR